MERVANSPPVSTDVPPNPPPVRDDSKLKNELEQARWVWGLLAAGVAIRSLYAGFLFLNADEILHYLISIQPSFMATYRATLTMAHPPLLILFLHYWGLLGHSELFLRLPSVVLGAAFCGLVFLWLRGIAGAKTALTAFALLLFSPALIDLSAEIRQYDLLLFFCAASCFFFDRSIQKKSASAMVASQLSLYLAILSHYSAFFFAASLGLYALLRLRSARPGGKIATIWLAGQGLALSLAAFLYKTQIAPVRAAGLLGGITSSYVSKSVLRPGQSPLGFFFGANIRFFHYLFNQQAVGIIALAFFVYGVILLLRNKVQLRAAPPWQLGLFLLSPFILNLTAAFLGFYPYGGTRHSSYLSFFAMCGIAIGIAHIDKRFSWLTPAILAVILIASEPFPAPTGQYIHPGNQTRSKMSAAMQYLQKSVPAGSTILTDHQGGLALSYYLCHAKVAESEWPFQDSIESRCGEYKIISLREWLFDGKDIQREAQELKTDPASLWFFQAGWGVDNEPEVRANLKSLGCESPREFGQNILACPLHAVQ